MSETNQLEGLEPRSQEICIEVFKHCTPTEAAFMSIAISLKRIADVLAGVPYDHTPGADNSRHSLSLTDGIMHAIEQGILAASQRG